MDGVIPLSCEVEDKCSSRRVVPRDVSSLFEELFYFKSNNRSGTDGFIKRFTISWISQPSNR